MMLSIGSGSLTTEVAKAVFCAFKRQLKFRNAFFLEESKNGFVIADHVDSSPPKNDKSEKGLTAVTK